MAKSVEDAKKRLDDEYGQVRRRFDEIHEKFDRVATAQPGDDLEGLLKDLEDKVHEVRTGGVLRHGANGYTRAKKDYDEAVKAAGGGDGKVTKFGS
jgi:hypothetical protein